jgi:hypothetical protein
LTVAGGPSFVTLSQRLDSTPPAVFIPTVNPKTGAPIGTISPSGRDGQVLRVGSAVRWTFFSHDALRLFLVADAEVDVTADAGNRMFAALAATSPLPTWSAGLSLGGALTVCRETEVRGAG